MAAVSWGSRPPADPVGRWNADFRKALVEARGEGKDHLVVFTGLEWEPWSRKLNEEALAKPEFHQALAGEFVLTHVDLPEKPKEPAELGELDTYQYGLARDFQLRVFPSLFLCTPDGRPYACIGTVEGGPEPVIAAIRARKTAYASAMEEIRGLEGPARARALDAWLEKLPEGLRSFHQDKMEGVVEADPRDTTGLWSKYQMALLLPKAREFRYTGRLAESEAIYLRVVDTIRPTGVALQDACYELSDVYFQQKDYDKLLDTLDRAIAAAPDSPRMSVLSEMTEVFTRQWIHTKYQPDRMKALDYDCQKIELPPEGPAALLKLIEEAKNVAPESGRNRVLDKMAEEMRQRGTGGGGEG